MLYEEEEGCLDCTAVILGAMRKAVELGFMVF